MIGLELFLSPEEVARLLRVSDQTVINMCQRGELRHVKFGKQYRIFREQIEQMIGRRVEGDKQE